MCEWQPSRGSSASPGDPGLRTPKTRRTRQPMPLRVLGAVTSPEDGQGGLHVGRWLWRWRRGGFGVARRYGAHLEGAYLSGAHLERAYLSGAHLEGANL
jgi:hypothetical protein